jgi:anti-sigma factor ChrR (cupin superfamily)
MRINADFTKRASVHAGTSDWVQSPMPGVERRMLDRVGDEVARATSIVRYAPGTVFSPHTHPGGEEFFVLDGIFQDERGDYPAGSYVRNPPASRHRPRSQAGCTIFVKLFQFDPADCSHVNLDTRFIGAVAPAGRQGVTLIPLFNDGREDVRLEEWRADASVLLDVPGGFEALVLEGSFAEGGETFAQHSWLRLPKGFRLTAVAGAAGARLWVKTGHLLSLHTHEDGVRGGRRFV